MGTRKGLEGKTKASINDVRKRSRGRIERNGGDKINVRGRGEAEER